MSLNNSIGVIADVHSNHIAFRAAIDYMLSEGCNEFMLLGDFVSDTPGTRETMELLGQLRGSYSCHILRGNREEYMLRQRQVRRGVSSEPRWLYNSACGNLLYCYERLTEEELDFFDSLPIVFTYERKGYPPITCCHGSPVKSNELLLPGTDRTYKVMSKLSTDYLVAAHSHIQAMEGYTFPVDASVQDNDLYNASAESMHQDEELGIASGHSLYQAKEQYNALQLPPKEKKYCDSGTETHKKTYINTGSCGVAIGAAGYAHGVILRENKSPEGEPGWKVELLRIPYDTEAVIALMYESGLYDAAPWFINNNIHILRTGVDITPELILLAIRLQKNALGREVVWPYIDEEYFAEASSQLGIPDYSLKRSF